MSKSKKQKVTPARVEPKLEQLAQKWIDELLEHGERYFRAIPPAPMASEPDTRQRAVE